MANKKDSCKWKMNENCTKYDETCKLDDKCFGSVDRFLKYANKDGNETYLKRVAEYDFKNEIHCCRVNKEKVELVNKHICNIVNAKSSIAKFLLYKKYNDENVYWEELGANKKMGSFDCDGSDGKCYLAQKVYKKLWGWEKKKENFGECCMNEIEGCSEKFLWGGDAMNSVMTTLDEYMKKRTDYEQWVENHSEITGKNKYEGYIEYFKGKEVETSVNRFSVMTNTLGNFVLVPAYYNAYRNSVTKDYWDLSLKRMKNRNVLGKHENEDIKWENQYFNQYVNCFFLWDYVVKDSYPGIEDSLEASYYVRSLFSPNFTDECYVLDSQTDTHSKSNKNGGEKLPSNENDIIIFFNNVNWAIKRRGIFMAAMLKIATIHIEDYKTIASKLFINDVFDGYEEVFDCLGISNDKKHNGKPNLETETIDLLRVAFNCIKNVKAY